MTFLFYLFAALALFGGIGVVVCRNPVSAAFSMVLSFLGLASLFIQLDAYLVGTLQVLVYAGAIMVLFLFIIMLLNLRDEETRRLNLGAWAGGGLVVIAFVGLLVKVIFSFPGFAFAKPPLVNPQASDVALVGETLFRDFSFPFQVVGILLLVSTVGVVLLSKKELK